MNKKDIRELERKITDEKGVWLTSAKLNKKEKEILYDYYIKRRMPFPSYLIIDIKHCWAMGYLYITRLENGLEIVYTSEHHYI